MAWTGSVFLSLMLVVLLLPGYAQSAPMSIEEQRAAATLFDRYETVFYAQGGLLTGRGRYENLSAQDATVLRLPFADLLGGLDTLGKQASGALLRESDAVQVGAKDFSSPDGPFPSLSAVNSHSCFVFVLKSESSFKMPAVARGVTRMSPGMNTGGGNTGAGNTVWKWSAPPDEGHVKPYRFFGMQVAQSYFLIADSLDDLMAVHAELLAAGPAPKLDGIRDWESLGQHEVWGYRRYRHDNIDKSASALAEVTPDVLALSFFFDPKERSGVLRIFSPTEGTAAGLNKRHALPPFKPRGDGIWETTISLAGDRKPSLWLLETMDLFGFGVYL